MDTYATAIILPTFNESETIGTILQEIITALPSIKVLVVDDSSPDGTADIVWQAMSGHSNIALLTRPYKSGLGSAYRAGVVEADRRWNPRRVVFMDADGSHRIKDLQRLLETKGDVVIGSRYCRGGRIQGWAWWRRLLSRCGNVYARTLAGIDVHDLTAGLMCISSGWLNQVALNACACSGYAFLMELKFNAAIGRASIVEIPITFIERQGGSSKLSWPIVFEGLVTPWRLRYRRFGLP